MNEAQGTSLAGTQRWLSFERVGRLVALLVVIGSLGIRLFWGLLEEGIYWPDEIYQSIEPAHRLVFGYGIVAWEFAEGARNWTFPGLIAVVLLALKGLGLDSPEVYLPILRFFFALMGAITTWGTYRLAKAYQASALEAAAAASLFGLTVVPVYFGHRAMSETASTAPVVWGLALLLGPPGRSGSLRVSLGAGLLGLATLLRLHNGIFCVGALLLLARRRTDALRALVVLVAFAMIYGVMDWVAWGQPFHSAIKYMQFNLIENRAVAWGTAPFLYYAHTLFRAMPGPTVALVALSLLSLQRAPGLMALAALFLLLHSWTPHKELRFVLPVLPVFAACAGIGLAELRRRVPFWSLSYAVSLALMIIALHSALRVPSLTFGDLGAYQNRPQASAWDDMGSPNRLMLIAHARSDLCGLKVEKPHLAWVGGQSYLHRPVLLYSHRGPSRRSGFYNYVLTTADAAGREQVVAQEGSFVLLRLRQAGCRADAKYSDRLP